MNRIFRKTKLRFEDGFEAIIIPNETAEFLFEKGNMDPYVGYKIITFDPVFPGIIEALNEYVVEDDPYGLSLYKGVPTDVLMDTLCGIHGDIVEREYIDHE